MKGVSGILDAVFKGVKDIKGQVDAKKNGTEAPALSDYSTPSAQSSSSASSTHSSSSVSYTEPKTKGECVDMMDNVTNEQMKISRKIDDLEFQIDERSMRGDLSTADLEAEIATLESRYNELDGIYEKLSQKRDEFYMS